MEASSYATALCAAALAAALGWLAGLWARERGPFAHGNLLSLRAPDGYTYRVHGGHEEAEEAAAVIARLNARAVELLAWLKKRWLGPRAAPGADEPIPGAGGITPAGLTRNLLDRYNPDAVVEASPFNPQGDTSFTLEKGQRLALCLRERTPPPAPGAAPGWRSRAPFHDLNTLAFVLVHELAHLGVDFFGHPPEYWQAFRWLAAEAAEAGVYRPVDYARAPVVYCGLPVTYSPLYAP